MRAATPAPKITLNGSGLAALVYSPTRAKTAVTVRAATMLVAWSLSFTEPPEVPPDVDGLDLAAGRSERPDS